MSFLRNVRKEARKHPIGLLPRGSKSVKAYFQAAFGGVM